MEEFFKFSFRDVQNRIMIENEIYCYIKNLVIQNVSNKTCYILGNKRFYGKIYILNFEKQKKNYLCKAYHQELKLNKVPIDDTIDLSLGDELLEDNL